MDVFSFYSLLSPVPSDRLNLHQQQGPVAIYGSGTAAMDSIQLLTARGINIAFVIDENTKKPHLGQFPILHLNDPKFTRSLVEEMPLIIAIFNGSVDLSQLIAKLSCYGWRNVLTFLDLHDHFPDALGDRYWLTRRDYYLQHIALISEMDALWFDDTSRDVYRKLLKFRVSGRIEELPALTSNQYFPPDIPSISKPLKMIDCGAYDGDTLRQLVQLKIPVESVVSFEPDLNNFHKMTRLISESDDFSSFKLTLFPCGVWDRTMQVSFQNNNMAASGVSIHGESAATVVALDDVLPQETPNYIKMDIEGAELEALEGAAKLIRKTRPRLSVCTYHKPEHLWMIGLFIEKWNLNYRLYLRSHMHNGFDTVLYALPA